MSKKYIHLNKINHYHDSSSKELINMRIQHIKLEDSRIKPPLEMMNNNNNRSNLLLDKRDSSYVQVVNGRKNNNNINNTMNSHHHDPHYYRINQINTKLAFFAMFSLLLILINCINGAHSLNCYHCSSVDNPGCDETFTANFTETDCEKHINRPAKVCRKIVQYIEDKKVVIRSCGYIDDHEEKDRKPICYKRSGTFAIMMESCNCYTDNCNHSASLVPHQSVLIFLVGFSILLSSYCLLNPSSSFNHHYSADRKMR